MKSYSVKFNFEPLKSLITTISKKAKDFKNEHIFPPYGDAADDTITLDTRKLVLILEERMKQMSLNVEALAAEVTRVQTVHESAIKFIANLTDELKTVTEELKAKNDAVIDTSALDELVAKLDASTDALAAAIATSHDNPVEAPVVEEEAPAVVEPEVVMEEEAPVVEEDKPDETGAPV